MKYLKSYESFELIVEKTLPEISPDKLIPDSSIQNQLKTNKEIISKFPLMYNFNGLKKQIELPKELSNPNNKNFLSDISDYLSSKGITPYLNVNTDNLGNPESISTGLSYTVPNTPININLQNGYYGADFDFDKFGLSIGYQPGSKEDIVGGYSDKATVPQSKIPASFTPNNKFEFKFRIPIGK